MTVNALLHLVVCDRNYPRKSVDQMFREPQLIKRISNRPQVSFANDDMFVGQNILLSY